MACLLTNTESTKNDRIDGLCLLVKIEFEVHTWKLQKHAVWIHSISFSDGGQIGCSKFYIKFKFQLSAFEKKNNFQIELTFLTFYKCQIFSNLSLHVQFVIIMLPPEANTP